MRNEVRRNIFDILYIRAVSKNANLANTGVMPSEFFEDLSTTFRNSDTSMEKRTAQTKNKDKKTLRNDT